MSRDGSRLFTQLTGQPKFEVFAESDKDFFLKVVDAQLTFETDASGKATAVVLHQNGVDQHAKRIEGEPVVPKGITLDAATLDGCVGRYQYSTATYTITREGTQLFAQITGQPKSRDFCAKRDRVLLHGGRGADHVRARRAGKGHCRGVAPDGPRSPLDPGRVTLGCRLRAYGASASGRAT